ncbi:anthranilate 1,2-dioxygenase electron transfer component AntC [Verticiella sediminum]|uniref:Anthranilate 1,2-dioxygenase electron transfer component AntC n=1 Tax=Verticiella sediminum TaxID=1247510 RepID=A0A556AXJ5_9BURK|nr:anthranilate 1,2-dioxygenase electron transfer component AntC [Verticiella sediminum]TSH97661.1 anthranilate 1,2-dioxygenase electron transfer component AntC [Verticiella sediminum]
MSDAAHFRAALSFADGVTGFIDVAPEETLLDAAVRQGLQLPSDCREGVCGTCQGQCESGSYTLAYVDDETLSPAELTAGRVLSCQTLLHSDAAFSFDFASTLCASALERTHAVRVTAMERVSPGAALIRLAVAGGQALDFLPGQYARLRVPHTGETRAYSFVNAPGADTVELLVRLLPDGAMSDYVRERCTVGDELTLSAPHGSFYLRDIVRPTIFAAGGTGISAFLAMLARMARADSLPAPVHLFYGVNESDDLCLRERLDGYARTMPGFTWTPVLARPDAGWPGASGLVTDHLDIDTLRGAPFDIYVCGPPGMVDALRERLDAAGLEHYRFFHEKFLPSGLPA